MFKITKEQFNKYDEITKNEYYLNSKLKVVNIGEFVVRFLNSTNNSFGPFHMSVIHNGNELLYANSEAGDELADKVFAKLDRMLEDYLSHRAALIQETFYGVDRF
jgi:hypothetical protein